MDQEFQCKFCRVKFHKETTLSKHLCVKKRRHMDLNTTSSRLGFMSFQKFYELTTNSKKLKTHEDFINSPYYIDFVRFGNHLALLKPVNIDQYINFVIMNSIKLKDWTKDFVYEVYINDLIKKEPATSATERTITEIADWCNQNKIEFKDFFLKISANEAAFMIKTGKISPWTLYLCNTGENLINRLNEDHAKMIGEIIDPGFWMKKFKKNEDDVEYIKNILEQAGL